MAYFIVSWDIQPTYSLEPLLWIRRELSGHETVALLVIILWGNCKAKYPSVFHGNRKRKDYQLKLHVDPCVTSVVQKMWRVTFSLKDKVTAKVNKLLEKNITEKVERPTAWVSPFVATPKASGT